MIVGASKDTEACYGVNKCAEIDFKNGKMMKGEGLVVFDPEQNEMYKFLGCQNGHVKRVIERVKREIRKRLELLVGANLNDENLMRAINSRVIPVAG